MRPSRSSMPLAVPTFPDPYGPRPASFDGGPEEFHRVIARKPEDQDAIRRTSCPFRDHRLGRSGCPSSSMTLEGGLAWSSG